MSRSPFNDPRALKLLSRVREDLSQLRHDISSLVSHTTHRTLPEGAKELADSAKHQFSAGSAYAAERLRSLRQTPPTRETLGVVGGILVVGLLAFGAYTLCKGNCRRGGEYDEAEFDVES